MNRSPYSEPSPTLLALMEKSGRTAKEQLAQAHAQGRLQRVPSSPAAPQDQATD